MRAKLSRTSSFVNTYEWAELKRDPNRCYCLAGCSLTSTTVLVTLQSPMSEAVQQVKGGCDVKPGTAETD
jgi:hypothetical protein